MSNKVQKQNSSETPRSRAAESNPLDHDLIRTWSRSDRYVRTYQKVSSLEDGNVRGGFWVLNKDCEGATLSFCFKNSSGRIFGLTVGHLFEAVGSSVFVFLHNEPTETPEANFTRLYEMVEIGKAVSKDVATDSAVFEVTLFEHRFDLLQLTPKAGLGDHPLTLPRPSLNPLPPMKGARAVICGAMSRGRECVVSNPSALIHETEHSEVLHKDIGYKDKSSDLIRASEDGDGGALLLDVTNGLPLAMHHAIIKFSWPGCEKPPEFEAFGSPLSLVMAKHPEQFDEQMFGSIETAPDGDGGEQNGSAVGDAHRQGAQTTASFQVKQFPVIMVKGDKVVEPSSGGETCSDRKDAKLDRSNAIKIFSHQKSCAFLSSMLACKTKTQSLS